MTENQRPKGASAPPPAGAENTGAAQEPNPLASSQLAESPQSDTRMADDPLGGKQRPTIRWGVTRSRWTAAIHPGRPDCRRPGP
jgi:hypothetical protein